MAVSDAKRFRPLEDENAKLKRFPAEHMLDAAVMKELLAKMVRPAVKRVAVAHLQVKLGLSARRACRLVGVDWKMIRYQSRRPPEHELGQRTLQVRQPACIRALVP